MNPSTVTLPHGMGGGMNQMLELFKMQYVMKFLDNGAAKGNTSIISMFILMGYDQLVKYVPFLLTAAWLWLQTKWYGPQHNQKSSDLILLPTQPPPPAQKQIRAYIQFERNPDRATDPRIDAVMYHVCNLPDVRSLRYNGVEMIPNFKDLLMIDNDVWFEIINPNNAPVVMSAPSSSKEARIEPILYRLSTYDHDITWLHKFVEETMDRYEQEKKNKLGSETYYFDQVTSLGPYSNPSPRNSILFSKSKFTSNRTLKNVYLRQIEELQERVEFFMRRRDWYDSKGIPHTLGIVMYGVPGCGKTSTIKAISNETRRHIFNIALSEIKTKEALKDLFYNEQVSVLLGEGKREVLTIPLKHRLYVIEDIDAMNSIVIKRSAEQIKEEQERKLKIEAEVELLKQTQGEMMARNMIKGKQDEDADKLDLATLLNVLDGVRETPGRIIILSTNYPERLDEALLRPGRFDMMIEFEKHSPEVLRQHLEKHYDVTLSPTQWKRINISALDKKWTPAEVSQILFRRSNNIDAAIDDLIYENPAKLFKFSQMRPNKESEAVLTRVSSESTIEETQGTDLADLIKQDIEGEKKEESDDDSIQFMSGGITLGVDTPTKEQLLAEKAVYANLFSDRIKLMKDQEKQSNEIQKRINELESTMIPIAQSDLGIWKRYKPEDEAKLNVLHAEVEQSKRNFYISAMVKSPMFANDDGYTAMNDTDNKSFETFIADGYKAMDDTIHEDMKSCYDANCNYISNRVVLDPNGEYTDADLEKIKVPTNEFHTFFPKPLQEFSF